MPEPLADAVYRDLIAQALAEDVGTGDITSAATVPAGTRARGVLLAKSSCVLAGLDVAREVFRLVDRDIEWRGLRPDGDSCEAGDEIALMAGDARALLAGERTALNLLQYLSGIATETRRFVEAADGRIVILDTRKTLPGYRALAKYAVRCGGGTNHRMGLYDGILIKDNHIRTAGGIGPAVAGARACGMPVEVEVQSVSEIDAALAAGADVIMLDNFPDDQVADAVVRIGGRARIELSGNMTLARVRALAASGADCVSIGGLTHSAPAADISLEIAIGE